MGAWAVVTGGTLLVLLGWGLARWLASRKAAHRKWRGSPDGSTDGWPSGSKTLLASGRSQLDPATPRGYSPGNVGNDASARPWESTYGADDPEGGFGRSDSGGRSFGEWPVGFDARAFLQASKANFVSLQDAWDRADMDTLRAMMTDDMLAQIQGQLNDREKQADGRPNRTEVVMIEAQLLGLEDLGQGHMASVEFSGMVREDASAGPSPFREIWTIARPKSGNGGWLVAGVQALQ